LIIVDYKLRDITEDQGLGGAFGTLYTMDKKEKILETGLARVLVDQVYWEQLEGVWEQDIKGKKLTGESTKFRDDTIHHLPVPVAARSKAKVCGWSHAEIVDSNPTGGMHVCLLCSVR